mmetsp:Transcript_13992/g.34595  ORF Transcript_13992/g.34595 Transcript_13992/m.34595 type:complete len:287 (-) Transcript_13992:1179-2039(-)
MGDGDARNARPRPPPRRQLLSSQNYFTERSCIRRWQEASPYLEHQSGSSAQILLHFNNRAHLLVNLIRTFGFRFAFGAQRDFVQFLRLRKVACWLWLGIRPEVHRIHHFLLFRPPHFVLRLKLQLFHHVLHGLRRLLRLRTNCGRAHDQPHVPAGGRRVRGRKPHSFLFRPTRDLLDDVGALVPLLCTPTCCTISEVPQNVHLTVAVRPKLPQPALPTRAAHQAFGQDSRAGRRRADGDSRGGADPGPCRPRGRSGFGSHRGRSLGGYYPIARRPGDVCCGGAGRG